MFDLEQSIAEWRRRMQAAGVKDRDILDELEGHLREEVQRLAWCGMGLEQAFATAVKNLGQPAALLQEFKKAGRRKWSIATRLKMILLGRFLPEPSLASFNNGAREVMELARAEAPRLHHNFIGTEHVLLALLRTEDGLLSHVLDRLNVDRARLKKEIEDWVTVFSSKTMGRRLPYTPCVKKTLQLAAREAKTAGQGATGPEHIFLGLIREGYGVAGQVLRRTGLDYEAIRQTILREMHS